MADQFQYPKSSTPIFTATLPAPTVPVGSARAIYPESTRAASGVQPGEFATPSWLSTFPTMRAAYSCYADQVLGIDAMTPY
jgi:hypothetical protein